jgi:GNAT superfamily N-acetyltransferase
VGVPVLDYCIRRATISDAADFCRVVKETYAANVAPLNTAAGNDFFLGVQTEEYYRRNLARWTSAFVALVDNNIVGVIGVRDKTHIIRFFILPKFQRQGIGRALLGAVMASDRTDAATSALSVNASVNSTPAYEALGFTATSSEQTVDDIRFVPMQVNTDAHKQHQ